MITNSTQESAERTAGRKAATTLRNDFRNQIKRSFKTRTGKSEKSTVTSRYKDGRLDRLVINAPGYSFKNHFGSSKSGTQGASSRKATAVNGFNRHIQGQTVAVSSYIRRGGSVNPFNKNRTYKAYNHIAIALRNTTALEKLATDLGENRITTITSQIQF